MMIKKMEGICRGKQAYCRFFVTTRPVPSCSSSTTSVSRLQPASPPSLSSSSTDQISCQVRVIG